MSLEALFTLETNTSLVTIKDEKADKVRIEMMSGGSCELYMMESETGYEVPSPFYYTKAINLKLNPASLSGENPLIFLITTPNPPVLLYISSTCNSHSASGKPTPTMLILVIILSLSIPAISILLTIIVIYRKRRTHRRRQIAEAFSIVPPSDPSHGISSELDRMFPVQVYSTLVAPLYTTCIVCMEAFTGEAEVRTLTCGHIYHKVCVEQLFRRMRKCGVCNREYISPNKETGRLFLLSDVLGTETNESVLNSTLQLNS